MNRCVDTGSARAGDYNMLAAADAGGMPAGSRAGEVVRRITVLVADDQPVVRKGAAAAIRRRPDLELVAEAADGAEALEAVRTLRPDVLLLDPDLPRLDGFGLIHAIAVESLPTLVLLFAEAADGPVVQRAVAAGAAGYVTKSDSLWSICDAIRRIASGERFLSKDAQVALLDQLRHGGQWLQPALSEREIEILRLTAQGISSARVGELLHISQSTVKNHQRRIYEKLGVSNAAAATYEAMRRGILR